VDNSAFSPTGLTIPLDPVYPSFNPSIRPFSSREDSDALPYVVIWWTHLSRQEEWQL
jgi:hypothetical protein